MKNLYFILGTAPHLFIHNLELSILDMKNDKNDLTLLINDIYKIEKECELLQRNK